MTRAAAAPRTDGPPVAPLRPHARAAGCEPTNPAGVRWGPPAQAPDSSSWHFQRTSGDSPIDGARKRPEMPPVDPLSTGTDGARNSSEPDAKAVFQDLRVRAQFPTPATVSSYLRRIAGQVQNRSRRCARATPRSLLATAPSAR